MGIARVEWDVFVCAACQCLDAQLMNTQQAVVLSLVSLIGKIILENLCITVNW